MTKPELTPEQLAQRHIDSLDRWINEQLNSESYKNRDRIEPAELRVNMMENPNGFDRIFRELRKKGFEDLALQLSQSRDGVLAIAKPHLSGTDIVEAVVKLKGILEAGLPELQQSKKSRPPLGDVAKLIYQKLKSLPETDAMTTPQIADWLAESHKILLDEATIRTNHLKQLESYGLFHIKRIGYCLRES